MLFEIQLLKAREPEGESNDKDGNFLKAGGPSSNYEDIDNQGGPEFSRVEQTETVKTRRGSHGLRSILLKGEMRYLRDVDMLVFLCSPL